MQEFKTVRFRQIRWINSLYGLLSIIVETMQYVSPFNIAHNTHSPLTLMSFLWAIEWIEANWMSIDGLIVPLFWNDYGFILIIGDFGLFFGSTRVQISHLIEHFIFFCCSCCCGCILFVLGTIPFTTIDGRLWEKFSSNKWPLSSHLYSTYIRLGGIILHVDLHQSITLQYNEP